MSRFGSIALAVVFVAAVLAAAAYYTRRTVEEIAGLEPLAESTGRVQLVLDEQDVGLVRQGTLLAVTFAVANTGTEKLSIRQALHACCGSDSPLPTFTIEPGHTGEVVAELSADELFDRGRKHVRFHTSDPTCPELWLTVRGAVVRHAAANDDNVAEESIWMK